MNDHSKEKYSVLSNCLFMIRYAWSVRKGVLLSCSQNILATLGSQITLLFAVPVILQCIEEKTSLTQLLGTIVGFVALQMFFSALKKSVQYVSLLSYVDIRTRILNTLQQKLCTTSYPNTLDPSFLDLLENSIENNTGNGGGAEAIWNHLSLLIINIISLIIYLYLLSFVNIWILISVAAISVLSGLYTRRVQTWEEKHQSERADYERKLEYISQKAMDPAMAKDIRLFGMASWLNEIHIKAYRLYLNYLYRREKHLFRGDLIDILLTFARNGAAYVFLIYFTLKNHLPASSFVLYFTAFSGFTAWITGIINEVLSLHENSIHISEIRKVIDYPEPFQLDTGLTPSFTDHSVIELKHVSFRYPGEDHDAVHDISLILHPGEKLAMVGLNGAGKTTLIKLICGLYDPTEGKILLDGINIREFNRRKFYELFSALFQNYAVLPVSIAENIAQQSEGLDEQRVYDCLHIVGLSEKINTLPNRIYTHLTRKVWDDGIELSGGETQRLLMARALYKNAPILILDEPTAALDPIAEDDIYQRYNGIAGGHLSVFISHRLASTRFCDRILYIENGRIAEEGTHDELIQLHGAYQQLFELQSSYYKKEGGEPDEKEI